MKMAKRVLSLVLAIAMLLTVATFPALADTAETYVHESKTVYLEAGHNLKPGYAGPMLLARPTNDFYVGDKLTLPAEGAQWSGPFTGTYAGITGFVLESGLSANAASANPLYVGIDANNVMTGFYPTLEDMQNGTNKTELTLDEAGKWMFVVRYVIDSTGAQVSWTNQGIPSLHNVTNPIRWTLDVKEVPTEAPVTAPELYNGLEGNAASILDSLTTTVADFTDDGTQNQAYIMDVGREEAGVDKRYDTVTGLSSPWSAELQTLKAQLGTTTVIAPIEGVRIDFADTAYVESVGINLGRAYLQYDVFGSLDGENWYPISVDNAQSISDGRYTISVKAIAKHIRIDYRDYNDHWGSAATDITALTGILNVPVDGWNVTFDHVVVENGEEEIADVVVTAAKDGTYTVPSAFAEGYSFYSDADCTVELDTTAAVAANTTVYVRLTPYEYTGKNVQLTASKKTVLTYAGPAVLARPTNDLYVGDKLTVKGVELTAALHTTNSSKLPSQAIGFAIETSYNYYSLGTAAATYYVGIDYTNSENGVLTGLYPTLDDMIAGTNEIDGIPLNNAGKWGFGIRYVWYNDGTSNVQVNCSNHGGYDNFNSNGTAMRFFFDVKAAPTVKDYEVEAPEKLYGLAEASTEIDVSAFVQDSASEDFDNTKNNLLYVSRIAHISGGIMGDLKHPLTHSTTSPGQLTASLEGIRFEFVEKSYIKDFTLQLGVSAMTEFVYDVFGSLDGENWYVISKDNNVASSTAIYDITVDAIVKYLRVDFRDYNGGYGYHATVSNNVVTRTIEVTSLDGILNVPDVWTLNFEHVVTQDGEAQLESATVETDINGNYTLPAQFATGEYSFYLDQEWTEKYDVTKPAAGNATVYVRLTPYEYVPKTVGIPASLTYEYNHRYNGPFYIARPTNDLYVGDSLTILDGTSAPAGIVFNSINVAAFNVVAIAPDGTLTTKYVKVDANGGYTGLFDSLTATETSPFVLNKTGKWAFAVTAIYDADGTNLAQSYYFDTWSYNPTSGTYRAGNQVGIRFYVDVKAAPTTENYQAETPEVLAGLASQSVALTIDTTDTTKAWVSETNTINTDKTPLTLIKAYNTSVKAYAESVNLVLDADTYVESFNFVNGDTRTVIYDVFGSLDGENWYAISKDNKTDTKNTTVNVGTVVKYLRVDIRDINPHWGTVNGGWAISNVVGVAARYSWNVTFTDGTTTKVVETDINGKYTVPAEFEGDFSFYTDADYTTKANLDLAVKGDTTIYVKADVYEYTPKTVYYELKTRRRDLGVNSYLNGVFETPKVPIYVGDTIKADVADYALMPIGGVVPNAITFYYNRFGATEGDAGESTWVTSVNNGEFTFTKPGVYGVTYNDARYYDEAGNPTTLASYTHGSYSCIITVLPAPTSEPEVAKIPEYTGEAKEVTALLSSSTVDIADETYAFMRHYNRAVAYADVDKAINTTLAHNTYPGYLDYYQFNLDAVSYVDNISITGTQLQEYDVLGSLDGENWYTVNVGLVSTNNVYEIDAVAKYVRVKVRELNGSGTGTITAYTVNGYAVEETAVEKENVTLKWVAANGTKTAVTVNTDNTPDLPLAYSDGTTNYAIVGWMMATADGLVDVALIDVTAADVSELGDLYAVVEEIPVEAADLTATLTAKGEDAGKFSSTNYINGFYVQGTQIRLATEDAKAGLRFVNIIDNALVEALKANENVTGIEYGTVVVAGTKYNGGDLVKGYASSNTVKGEKLFADAADFEGAYFKYTVCVTGIPEAYWAQDVVVRPYLTFTYNGNEVTLYGEQYATSLYETAVFALETDSTLDDTATTYLQSIVDSVEG